MYWHAWNFLSHEIWLHTDRKPFICCHMLSFLLCSTKKLTWAPSYVIDIDCIVMTNVFWYDFRLDTPPAGREAYENLNMPASSLFMLYYELSTVHGSWHHHYTSLWSCMNVTIDPEHRWSIHGNMLETSTIDYSWTRLATLLLHGTRHIGKYSNLIHLSSHASPLLLRA